MSSRAALVVFCFGEQGVHGAKPARVRPIQEPNNAVSSFNLDVAELRKVIVLSRLANRLDHFAKLTNR